MNDTVSNVEETMPESMMNREKIISEALDTIKDYHKRNVKLEATASRLQGLLERANMALLMYTQSHGTPPGTQLLDEMAEVLGLDADGKPLELVEEKDE